MSDMSNQIIWEDIYKSGHQQRAPWDMVVSFVYRFRPKDKGEAQTKILEIGCGTAGNLKFFAQEGFQVSGIDFSGEAIEKARQKFEAAGLKGFLEVGKFEALQFQDNAFDLVIDRAALTCVGESVQRAAIDEVYRVLRPSGFFFYTPYADTHTSHGSGVEGQDKMTMQITRGTLQGVGDICFQSRAQVEEKFDKQKWRIHHIEYETRANVTEPTQEELHSSWRVVVQKL